MIRVSSSSQNSSRDPSAKKEDHYGEKKAGKKKATKKAGPKKQQVVEDPPIIVGGGGSEIIKICADLLVTPMTPASGYTRFRVQGVNIKNVNVFDGSNNHPHAVSSAGNKVMFSE